MFNLTFEIIHGKVVDQLKKNYLTQVPIFILSLGLEKFFKEWNSWIKLSNLEETFKLGSLGPSKFYI